MADKLLSWEPDATIKLLPTFKSLKKLVERAYTSAATALPATAR